ncbi:hypothetical protein GQ457_17G006410 [Hibiscus cannabinus]
MGFKNSEDCFVKLAIKSVRTRNWKLRGGENRLSGLLEGVSVSGNVFTWLSSERFGMTFGEVLACCSPDFCNSGVEYRYPIRGIDTQFQHWNLGIGTC